MKNTTYSSARMRGLTLIETLVAITISLILLGGTVTLLISNKHTYQVNDNLSRLQENARFAIEFISQDLRMAGYFGCNNSSQSLFNQLGAAVGSLGDTTNSIEGSDQTGNWSPTGNTDRTGSMVTVNGGTDGITIRRMTGTDRRVIADVGINGPITLADASGFADDGFIAISDCGGTDIVQIDEVDYNTNVITLATGQTLNRPYDAFSNDPTDVRNPRLASFVAVRYYIGTGANGPALFRQFSGSVVANEELIEGVDNMQILYGIDTTGDTVADNYVVAGAATLNSRDEWLTVVSIKIALLMRTVVGYGNDLDTNTYQLHEVVVPAQNDTIKRRVFNTTILLRNRLSVI